MKFESTQGLNYVREIFRRVFFLLLPSVLQSETGDNRAIIEYQCPAK